MSTPALPWNEMFSDYVMDMSMSYQKLADKYQVSLRTIEDHAGKDMWPRKRANVQFQAQQRIQEQAAQKLAAYKEKLIRIGQLLSGKGIKKLADDGLEPSQPKDVLNYVTEGIKMEGLGLGFIPPGQSVKVDATVEPGKASVTMTWANGEPLPPYRKPIETPEEEAAWLAEEEAKRKAEQSSSQLDKQVDSNSVDSNSQNVQS